MKRSSIAALVLTTLYIGGAVVCDFVLVAKYKTVALDDPMKNFSQVVVKPFTALSLRGGNGYAVKIRQGSRYDIRLMNSRKSFFKMQAGGDSLDISFGVANQTYQSPQSCVVGLIITVPKLTSLVLSGTNNIIDAIEADSLQLFQDQRTFTRIRRTHFKKLTLIGTQESAVDLEQENTATNLFVRLQNRASVTMNGISFDAFQPLVKDSARLIFFGKPLVEFKKNY